MIKVQSKMSLESLGIFREGSKIDRQESIAPSRYIIQTDTMRYIAHQKFVSIQTQHLPNVSV
jgi:hypothetical protein